MASPRSWGSVGLALIGTIALGLLPSASPRAEDQQGSLRPLAKATFYEVGSERQKVLYHWMLSVTEDGRHNRVEHITPEGELAAAEHLLLRNGEFESYSVTLPAAGRSGQIVKAGDRVEFYYTNNGKTETRVENYPDDFAVGPTIVYYIQSHWARVMKGEDLVVRFGIYHRMRTIRLKIEREGEKEGYGEKLVVLKLRPASFILATFVKPIYFTFSADGRRVYDFVGRTVPLRKVDGRWNPVQVDGVFREADRTTPGLRVRGPADGT